MQVRVGLVVLPNKYFRERHALLTLTTPTKDHPVAGVGLLVRFRPHLGADVSGLNEGHGDTKLLHLS